ncbi:MAG: YraN family protein [Candidatus Zixiibacteriota bacterium]
MRTNQRKKGEHYEEIAAQHLRGHGYDIIAQNYRSGRNEIDIICRRDNQLIFVEVKSSATDSFGDAAYKVNLTKQQSIIAAAQGYIQNANVSYESYRFDVIVIVDDRGEVALEHREAAFTL